MLSEMGYTTKLLKTFNLIKNWCEKIKGNRQSDEKRLLCRLRRNSLKAAKIRPGTDCDSDYEVFIAKFILKLKKVWKTTRLFRYDLNQIPYNYTVTWQIDSRDYI